MGLAWSFLSDNYFPGKPVWSVDQIPDLTGFVVLVTGGNSGLGKETAKELLKRNAKVYIAARSKEKAEEAIRELEKETGQKAHFLELDLADLRSVKTAAEDFMRRESQLHILYNNAGVMLPPVDQITAQGFDLQFGVNVLGHFYLTQLLLPVLLSTAPTTRDKKVRVVNLTSWANHQGTLDYNTFKDGPARRKKSGEMYPQSKFANIVFSNELARRYGEQGIISISVHPGAIDTGLLRYVDVPVLNSLIPFLLHPVSKGVISQLRAGTAVEMADPVWNGKYLIPWGRLGKPNPKTEDLVQARQLWEYMEEQVQGI